MLNITLPYLSLSSPKNCIPKDALKLSELNQLSLPLCEILVKNAPNNDSIFYAIMDVKGARRIVKSSSDYNRILNSDNNAQKKELFEELLKKDTFNIFNLANCEDEVIDILTKELCS